MQAPRYELTEPLTLIESTDEVIACLQKRCTSIRRHHHPALPPADGTGCDDCPSAGECPLAAAAIEIPHTAHVRISFRSRYLTMRRGLIH